MAEDHAQLDRIWQEKPGVGRQRMKRGILAYRKAYPDIVQQNPVCFNPAGLLSMMLL